MVLFVFTVKASVTDRVPPDKVKGADVLPRTESLGAINVPSAILTPPEDWLLPCRVNVPVPDFCNDAVPAMEPDMVKESLPLTTTEAKEWIPVPASVSVFPLDPMRFPVKAVVMAGSTSSIELSVTLTVPDVVIFPVACKVPPDK